MFTAVKAKKHLILNHKFINESSQWVYGEICEMSVGKLNKTTDAVIEYALTYQGMLQDYRFNNYDKRVYNAVCSLYDAGNSVLTPSMVYRQMNALDSGEWVSVKTISAITDSIDKLKQTFIVVDFAQESTAYKNAHDTHRVRDYLIDGEKVAVDTGNRTTAGYRLHSKPLLYKYFQMNTNHIISVDTDLLDVKDTIKRDSRNVILLKEYIIQRIAVMKRNGNKTSNRVLFNRLYEVLGYSKPTEKNIRQTRDNTEKILQSLANKGYIKNYVLYRKGRAFKGIEVNW